MNRIRNMLRREVLLSRISHRRSQTRMAVFRWSRHNLTSTLCLIWCAKTTAYTIFTVARRSLRQRASRRWRIVKTHRRWMPMCSSKSFWIISPSSPTNTFLLVASGHQAVSIPAFLRKLLSKKPRMGTVLRMESWSNRWTDRTIWTSCSSDL